MQTHKCPMEGNNHIPWPLFQDFKQGPWCSLIHRAQAELLCLLWQSLCTGWYVEICAISSGLFGLFGKQQLFHWYFGIHKLHFICGLGDDFHHSLFQIWQFGNHSRSHIWFQSCMEGILDFCKQTTAIFLSGLQAFWFNICLHFQMTPVHTYLWNSKKVLLKMLIQKPFALLAVMDRPTLNLFGGFFFNTTS